MVFSGWPLDEMRLKYRVLTQINHCHMSMLQFILQCSDLYYTVAVQMTSPSSLLKMTNNVQFLPDCPLQLRLKDEKSASCQNPTSFFKIKIMNSLIFNPNATVIDQWSNVYLNGMEVEQFQTIIDRAYSYLTAINSGKTKTMKFFSEKVVAGYEPYRIPSISLKHMDSQRMIDLLEEGEIERYTTEIESRKEQFKQEYKEAMIPKSKNEHTGRFFNKTQHDIGDKLDFYAKNYINRVKVCQKHLQEIKHLAMDFYEEFINKENKTLLRFIRFKLLELEQKITKVMSYIGQTDQSSNPEQTSAQIRILFDNLFIETEYLRIMVHKNLLVLDEPYFNENSGDDAELTSIRNREHIKLKALEERVEALKFKIRVFYFDNYSKKKAKLILKDSTRLEKIIIKDITVNEEDNDISIQYAWINGFICAILLITLGAIIVFRQININELENQVNYQIRFQIWRGASYLIIFNWVCSVVFYILTRWNINYKLVIMENHRTLGNASQFFKTAAILTVIYLILFLVDILYRLKYFEGHEHFNYLGYYMWLLNVIFILNPFRILNYQSRVYFLYMLKKVAISPFRPMNLKIFFTTTIISSFAQPLNDFSFTIFSLINNDKATCTWYARVTTFAVLLLFFSIRIAQGFRMHIQFGQGKCFSRARMRILAVVCSIITIIASFLYALRNSQEMLVFWIVTGSIATIARSHSEIRADWGLFNFDEDQCPIRKSRGFSKSVYYIGIILDPILDVAWVLTISNNVDAFLHINVLYFFLLLGTIELIRRGFWMVLRIEEDHSINVFKLQAMADDSHIVKEVQKALEGSQSEVKGPNNQDSLQQLKGDNIKKEKSKTIALKDIDFNIQQEPPVKTELMHNEVQVEKITLEEIQELVALKKMYSPKITQFLSELTKYFNFVRKTYEKITEEHEI